MKQRPWSITIIAWVFIVVCTVGLIYHFLPEHRGEMSPRPWQAQGWIWVALIRLMAIVGGVFLLAGFNWARWLLIAWMGYHVVLSSLHSLFEVAVHSLLFGIVIWLLFRPPASAYLKPHAT